MKFLLEQNCHDLYKRPRVSSKIIEYFNEYVNTNILNKTSFVKVDSWSHHLLIDFDVDRESLIILPPTIYKKERIKSYLVLFPLNEIYQTEGVVSNYIKAIKKIIEDFVLKRLSLINKKSFEKALIGVDEDYLFSFNFPAPFDDQKYIGDGDNIKRQIYLEKFGF